MLKLTTDKHEASSGLSATAELLVRFKYVAPFACYCNCLSNTMHKQNINLSVCVSVCVSVTLFVNSPTGQTPQRIFTVDSLKDADLRKDVPVGNLDD